ncbi:MAG: DUF4956 domain-containing protein [Spirochaetaceae bacterium]|nr:DUF4956 domain-containing protein [Spirochaetaceae bacterium]MBP5792013.1 DUF4956 domain-containing protein [Spirochaetaceae bacterium]
MDSFFEFGKQDITILINMGFALAAGLLTASGYCISQKRRSYSKSVVATIMLLPVVVAVVIPLITTDLKKALSLAGIFALVRFRSVPGDAKDIFYIFFTLTVGVAIALGYHIVAFTLLIIVSSFFVVMNRCIKFSEDQILRITIPEDMNYNGAFDDIFEKYLSKAELTDVKTSNMGTLFTISYSIHLKDESKVKEMIDELRTRNGNLTVVVQMDPQMFMKL